MFQMSGCDNPVTNREKRCDNPNENGSEFQYGELQTGNTYISASKVR